MTYILLKHLWKTHRLESSIAFVSKVCWLQGLCLFWHSFMFPAGCLSQSERITAVIHLRSTCLRCRSHLETSWALMRWRVTSKHVQERWRSDAQTVATIFKVTILQNKLWQLKQKKNVTLHPLRRLRKSGRHRVWLKLALHVVFKITWIVSFI